MLELVLLISIFAAVAAAIHQSRRRPEAAMIVFTAFNLGRYWKVVKVLIKVNQSLPLSIGITDKAGNPAAVDGAPAWSLTDPSLGSLDVAGDGMSAAFTPAGKTGELKVQVSADADLGAGVKQIVGELDLQITGGDAATIALSGGTPVDL